MRKLFRATPLLFAAALMVPAFVPTVASASPVDQQRQRVEDIVDQLERLEEEARRIGEEFVLAVDAKAALDDDIVETEARVAAQEAEIVGLRGDLGEMAIRSFVGSGGTPLGPLFEDTNNLNSVMQRDEYARVALSAGTVTTDELNSIVDDLEDERTELGRKREEAVQLQATLEQAQIDTEQLTGEYTAARADAEAKLGQLIAEEEARRAAESLARVRAEVAAQQAANSAAGSNNSNSSSSGNSASSGSTSSGSTSSGSTSNSGGGSSSSSSSGGSSAPAAVATPQPAAPKVSSRAGTAVNAAMSQRGVPYKYATSKPGVSFDCSGLTGYAWAQAGVYLPHQSRAQYASVPHVAKSAAQPGDLIFFYSPISHVSIYLGGGQHVHAPNTGSVVKVGNVNWSKVTGVGRPG